MKVPMPAGFCVAGLVADHRQVLQGGRATLLVGGDALLRVELDADLLEPESQCDRPARWPRA